jgi:hypothetical protein
MASCTRNNHFVPVWYQKGFLAAGEGELFVFDKESSRPISLPDGTTKKVQRRSISRRGPYKFLRNFDLYTTRYLGQINDEIERRLFGQIDDRGARAVALFKNWPETKTWDFYDKIPRSYGDPNLKLTALIEYVDAQKIRTPKGLAFLKFIAAKSGLIAQQNQLMTLMQNWRQFFCTLLAEGFWEIVGAHQSQTKFIFSDDPATVYNCDHYPASQMCQFPLDPHIFERGTRIIFPLDRDNCLLISHIEHSKEPKRSKARLHRRNARAYDRTIISFLDVHRSRELTSVEVATINYVIKRRAVRYTAAGSEGDLNPESQIGDPSWCNIDAIFQHDGFPRKLAGGEMMIKYEDESILSSNEYGEHSLVPGWFVRQRQKQR